MTRGTITRLTAACMTVGALAWVGILVEVLS